MEVITTGGPLPDVTSEGLVRYRGRILKGRVPVTIPQLALICDTIAVLAVAAVATALRREVSAFDNPLDRDIVWVAGPIILLGWIAIIAALGGYREQIFGAGTDEYRIVGNATLLTAGLVGVSAYLTQVRLPRSYFVLGFALGVVALIAARFLLRRGIQRARKRGVGRRGVVIAGTPANVAEIARVLSRETWLGYQVLGAVLPPGWAEDETVSGTPVLGSSAEILDVLDEVNADIIFVAGGALDGPNQMRELMYQLEALDVEMIVAPNVTDVSRERIRIRPIAGLPLIHIDRPRHLLAGRSAKRFFDISVSTCILLGVAPVLLAVALAIKFGDRGPVFFRQQRVGRDGHVFGCLKFRTMVVDAEERLPALRIAQDHGGGLFKMKKDPRVTGAGRVLRRFSIDELPQLLNVFRGEMSLVGPRPPLLSEVANYDQLTRRRLHVRPGMTGLWQVSGRSDLSWDESIRLDLYYVDNWSMVQDLVILARTFSAVLSSRGAY